MASYKRVTINNHKVNTLGNTSQKIIDWLFKDVSIINNLVSLLLFYVFFIILFMVKKGFDLKLFNGYFEMLVIILLIFITFNTLNLSVKGWGYIGVAFITLGGYLLIYSGNLNSMIGVWKIISTFAACHVIYLIVKSLGIIE